MKKTMINEKTETLHEAYLIDPRSNTRKGIVILSTGERVEIPIEQLQVFTIPDFYLN